MCDACEDWDAREPREPVLDPRLAPRAREIERGMPGNALGDAAWRIALGEETGTILWSDYERILAAFEAARPTPKPFGRNRRGARFRCAAAG
jgi:hypothetical protein